MAMHRWRGYDHPELHRMINEGPGPAASTPQTEYWEALLNELGEIDADLNTKLGTLAASWEGAAADGAQTALNPLQQWASDAQTGASGMRASTEYQADMIARARAEMPEPVPVTTPAPSGWAKFTAGAALLTGNAGPAAAVAAQAVDHEGQEAAQDAASQQAVDTMDSYSSSSEFNRNTLGEFVPPPDVVVATPTPSGGTGASAGTFSGSYGGPSGGGAGTTPAGYTPAIPPPGGGGGYTPPPSGGGGYVPVGPPGGGPTTPTGYVPPTTTIPSGYVPPSTGPVTPGGTTPGLPPTGPNPNLAGGGGGALPLPGTSGSPSGGGSRGGGGLGSRPGAPGMFTPGAVDSDGTRQNAQPMRPGGESGMAGRGGVTPGAGMSTGAGSRGGGAGMGGGAMGGRGAPDEEDAEYSLADYLIETEDVWGDERIVSSSVIGETPEK